VCSSNAKIAKSLYIHLKNKNSDLNIVLYTKDVGDKKDFENVNEVFQEIDVLLYSPTLTAGVSFEVAHFDAVYGIFDPESCNAESCS